MLIAKVMKHALQLLKATLYFGKENIALTIHIYIYPIRGGLGVEGIGEGGVRN